MTSLAVGFGLGFFVGAQPGPVSLLCIRSVLRGALASGIAIGAGARTLWAAFRVRLGGESEDEGASPRRAFTTAVAATASNPLTIATWAAIFTAASAASVSDAASSAGGAALMLGGVALGTLSAFTSLSVLVALVRQRFGPRLLATVDVVAGSGLLGFAGLLGWRALHES